MRWNLNEEVGLIEVGIKVFEDVDWNEQRAANGQGIVRMLVCLFAMKKD